MLLAACLPAVCWAAEFRSVAADKAVLYDAPSSQGKKRYLVGLHYPLEVVVNLGAWVKVRDARGEMSWIEVGDLAVRRTVLVTVAVAEVRENAEVTARLVFRAAKDVALELLEAVPQGWAKVRHADGLTGYIQSSQVWGL